MKERHETIEALIKRSGTVNRQERSRTVNGQER
jgi:hypothetical protein